VPAAEYDENVWTPRVKPATGGEESHDATCQEASASRDDFGAESVAVAPEKVGDGGAKPLPEFPALVLETREILVAASTDPSRGHSKRRGRILKKAS
jgi:hypothetical protein